MWSIEKDLYNFIELCQNVLSDSPMFMIINTYTGGLSGTIIQNVVRKAITNKKIDNITFDEIGLKQKGSDIFLPCGITTICEFK